MIQHVMSSLTVPIKMFGLHGKYLLLRVSVIYSFQQYN